MKKFISQCVVAALCLFVVSCSGGGGSSSKAFGDGCISNEEIAKLVSNSRWYFGLRSKGYESKSYSPTDLESEYYKLWKDAGLITCSSSTDEYGRITCQLTDKGKQYITEEDEYSFTVRLGKPVFEVYHQVCTVDKERNTTKAVVKVIADLEDRTPFVTEAHRPRTAWMIDYFWKDNDENVWRISTGGGGPDQIKKIGLPQGK